MTDKDNNGITIISQFFWPEPIGSAVYSSDIARWISVNDNTKVITGEPYYPEFKISSEYLKVKKDYSVVGNASIIRLKTIVPIKGKTISRLINELFFFINILLYFLFKCRNKSKNTISFCPSIFTVIAGNWTTSQNGRHVTVIHDIQSGLADSLGMIGNSYIIKLFKLLENYALNRASSLIVLTEQMANVLRKQGVTSPIHVIPLWVDLDHFTPQVGTNNEVPTILYSGNLGKKQGIEQILDVAEEFIERDFNIRIKIRGEGTQKKLIAKEIQRRSLTNIDLLPLVDYMDLPNELNSADLHILPQIADTADYAVPSKVFSILAIGKPIITTAYSGTALHDLESQTDGCITCSTPGDRKELADRIITLLESPSERKKLGKNGRIFVEKNCSKSMILKKYRDILLNYTRDGSVK